MTPPSKSASPSWHLVTGEYPPGGGGVGEYTRQLARALAAARREVHVWAPDGAAADARVAVHPVPGFGRTGLAEMGRALDGTPSPRRLLVQYAPQAFGMRGMNVGFCRWVLGRARLGDEVRVMFHEPYVEFSLRHPRRTPIAAANRAMAMLLLRAASVAYVSTPAWERLLRPWAPRRLGAMPWLPIPSTVPRVDDPEGVALVRAGVGANAPGVRVVGHFGTYGGMVAPLLEPALRAVLSPPSRSVALLLGDGGPAFAARLERADPALRGRVTAPGRLSPERLSVHLQACDVALQPYPDGVTARRTTMMAALANGVPSLTTAGRFTEDEWRAGPVPLSPAGDAGALAAAALDLLDDPARRAELGAAGRAFYERHFAMERTLGVLLDRG
jgi:glycosyltransferase involved in cell wall biosynthesis